MVMKDLHEGFDCSDVTGSDVDVVSCGSTEGGMDGILRRLGASGSSGSGVVDVTGGSVSEAVISEDEVSSEGSTGEVSSEGSTGEVSSEGSADAVSGGSVSRLGSGGISALLAERSREVRGDLGAVSVRSVSSMIASRGGSSTARSVGSVLRERMSGGLRGRGCGTKVIG